MKRIFVYLLVVTIFLSLGLSTIVGASPPHTPPGLAKKMLGDQVQITPGKNLTRLEAVHLAVEDLNLTIPGRNTNIKDFKGISEAYADYVSRLMELGVFPEMDSFQPNKPLTRAEMAVLIVKLTSIQESKSTDITLSRFNDKNAIPAYARSSVAALIEEGIIVGGKGPNNVMVFQPNAPVTLNVWNIVMERIEKKIPDKNKREYYSEVEGEILYLGSFRSINYILIKTAADIQLHDVTNAVYPSGVKFNNLKVGVSILLTVKDGKVVYLDLADEKNKRVLDLEFDVRYTNGQIILSVINKKDFDILLDFPTLQIYDFVVKDSSGNEVWQWSKGRSFGQQYQTISYNKSTTIEYQEAWRPGIRGSYTIEAYLMGYDYKDKPVATTTIRY